MERAKLLQKISESRIFTHWHWFRYHFERHLNGVHQPFAEAVVATCLACEAKCPGYAETIVERIAAIGGREKHLPDWEQLIQIIAELHVVNRLLNWPWPGNAIFHIEPTATGTKKNPELVIELETLRIGIEVKAPSLFKHIEQRSTNPRQIASRFAPKDVIEQLTRGEEHVTFPRDNPMKDYLLSAEEKFSAFCAADPEFIGILVVVWDDFIYEPISALVQPDSGLFTENSFFKTSGLAHTFPSVSGVVTIRHLHQIVHACRDTPLLNGCLHALDYGVEQQFPWKAFIQNPSGRETPELVIAALDARTLSDEMGAEYRPQEYIMWISTPE